MRRSVKEEIKLTDIISGFVDIYAEANPAPAMNDAASESRDSDDDSEDDDPPPNPLDPEEVLLRFGDFQKLYKKVVSATKRNGRDHKRTIELRAELQEKFLEFKLAPKHTELLASRVRVAVEEVRQQEKAILDICVKDCKMPRKDFLKAFIDAEADSKWLRSVIRQKKPYAAAIKERQSEIQHIQGAAGANRGAHCCQRVRDQGN